MRFAKAVFGIAGIFGVLALTPLYFIYGRIGRLDPPPLTHPQFYYGFAGVAMAWQFTFFLIATDPARFRPMMIPSVLEKLIYVGTLVALWMEGRLAFAQVTFALPDLLLGLLFVVAFWKTTPVAMPDPQT